MNLQPFRKTLLYLVIFFILPWSKVVKAQGVAINSTNADPHASAQLDVSSTTQGMLVPRMTAAQRGLIGSPATGLLVYQTDAPAGFYFYNGTVWSSLNAYTTVPVANGGTGTSLSGTGGPGQYLKQAAAGAVITVGTIPYSDITGTPAALNLTGPITSVGNATSVASQTGTGSTFVMSNSPTLVTPNVGIATATSVNKVTVTAPAVGSTLTIDNGFTLRANGNATVSGTNTGDQTITLTGDVTGSGTGSFATTIGANKVTYGQMQAISSTAKLLGSSASSTAVQEIVVGSGLSMTGNTLSTTGGGSGSVTNVSVTNANGFAGSVATSTTTPAITLTTSVNGMVKGDGTALSAATAGTDYVAPNTLIKVTAITATTNTFQFQAATKTAVVYIVGGGGGGGGTATLTTTNTTGMAGGGGSGEYKIYRLNNPTVATNMTITINSGGAGGTGGGSSTNGTAGGSVVFNASTVGGISVTCNGGNGGTRTQAGGGSGAAGSGGAGGAGAADVALTGISGGVGALQGQNFAISGVGASTLFGFGFGGAGAFSRSSANQDSAPGNAATGYGAGGSGAIVSYASGTSGIGAAGGAGTNGIVMVYEYK